jgi:hypothetical protein
MRNKATGAIVLSIAAVIGGMVLNFPEFSMGSPANIKNLIVTFTYIAIWIIVLGIGIKIMNRGLIKYSSVFWLITLLLALLTWYANVTEVNVSWAIPFAILLLGQWYGINFFVGSLLTTSIVITFISLVMFTSTAISLKRTK